MSPRTITAAEAQALLDGTTPGPWRAEPFGVVASVPDDIGNQVACAFGRVAAAHIEVGALRDANAALLAAAPDLARTIIAHVAEIERLRAIIDDAGATLDSEHLATCVRAATRYAHCDCVIGRVRFALTKAVSL